MSLETQLVRMMSNESDFISNQETLTAAKNEAEHQAKSRTEFLCNISHELRTPLGAVLGYSELVTQQLNMCQTINDFTQSKSEILEMIGVISHNGRELTRLVNSLLDFAKLERGNISVECSEFSLQSLITDVANTMQLNAQQKHLFFNVHCGSCGCNPIRSPDLVPDRIVSDSMRIRQILVNLLGNSFKFTAQGGVNLGVSFRSSSSSSNLGDSASFANSSPSPPSSIHPPPPTITATPLPSRPLTKSPAPSDSAQSKSSSSLQVLPLTHSSATTPTPTPTPSLSPSPSPSPSPLPASAPHSDSADTAITADMEALRLQYPDTGALVLSVADTGCGITKEQADRLFKPFSQGDSSIAHRFGGTGLGLALSRDLARLLGGDLVLRHSSVELGTLFEVSIPVRFLRTDPTFVSLCACASPSPLSSTSTTPVAAKHTGLSSDDLQQDASEPPSSSISDERPASAPSPSFSFPSAPPTESFNATNIHLGPSPVSVPATRIASGTVLPDALSAPAAVVVQKRVLSPAEQLSSSLQTIALSGVSNYASSLRSVARGESASTRELASSPLFLPNVAMLSSSGPAQLMGLYQSSDSFTTAIANANTTNINVNINSEQGTVSNSSSLSNITNTSPRSAEIDSAQRPAQPRQIQSSSTKPAIRKEPWPPIDPSSNISKFSPSEIGSAAESNDAGFAIEGSCVASDFASPSNPSTFSPASSIGSRDTDRSEVYDSPLPAARPVSVLRPLKVSPLIANRNSLRHWTRRGQSGSPNPSAPATPELSSRAHASVSAVFTNQNSPQTVALNHSASSNSVTGRAAATSGVNSTVAAVGSLFGATDLSRKFPLRILVVDDHAISRRLLMKMLQTAGYTSEMVSAAEDGEQALRIACAQNFDLILMDVQMPKMGGCEAASAIRDYYANLPSIPKPPEPPTVIALTAQAMKGDKERCLQSGMHDYLSKPIDWTLLFAKVIHWGSQRLDMH